MHSGVQGLQENHPPTQLIDLVRVPNEAVVLETNLKWSKFIQILTAANLDFRLCYKQHTNISVATHDKNMSRL